MKREIKRVLAVIRKHTDSYGWGLELSEIEEFTKYRKNSILEVLRFLVKTGIVYKQKSAVANHMFYNLEEKRHVAKGGV